MALFGEVRIAKAADSGEIFTGIGRAGWTHRLRWSDFYGASNRAVGSASSRRFASHTTHYVGLNGTSKSYKFGSELSEPQRAFVIPFLRQRVFGVSETPAPEPPTSPAPERSAFPPKATGDGKTVGVEYIRQTLEKAKLDYSGRDPGGFSRAADDFLASLREQYGEHVPAADAFKRIEKFARANGANIEFSFGTP